MSHLDTEEVKKELRSRGDEYHYRDEVCDIGGDLIYESHLEVSHFVVARPDRNRGIASTLLDCLLEVLHEDGIHLLTIEMGATEVSSEDELETYREETGEDDPTAQFLDSYEFRDVEADETYQWGLVFRGTKPL